MSTIATTLQEATARLRPVSPTARLDAELLLAHVLGLTRTQLIVALPDPVAAEAAAQFAALVARRIRLEPIAYLTGEREFFGLSFAVDQRVLVPRPETELLVALALQRAADFGAPQTIQVADIGTGSGAIAIAVATHLPAMRVYAVDISARALAVAAINVKRHHLEDRIVLIEGSGIQALPEPVDLLLTNPPYTILSEVDENVRRHEPHLALDGGGDGLTVIRELLRHAPRYVTGAMLIEIGAWQGEAVVALARAAFPGASVHLHRDLAGLDRVVEVNRLRSL